MLESTMQALAWLLRRYSSGLEDEGSQSTGGPWSSTSPRGPWNQSVRGRPLGRCPIVGGALRVSTSRSKPMIIIAAFLTSTQSPSWRPSGTPSGPRRASSMCPCRTPPPRPSRWGHGPGTDARTSPCRPRCRTSPPPSYRRAARRPGLACLPDGVASNVKQTDVDAAIQMAKVGHTILSEYQLATRSPRRDSLFREVLLACALAPKDDLGYFTTGGVRGPRRGFSAGRSRSRPSPST